MHLEEVYLNAAIEETNAGFIPWPASGFRQPMQDMGVAKETASPVIFDIEEPSLLVCPIRSRKLHWRAKGSRIWRNVFRLTNPEGNGRGDEKSQRGGRSKWQALFLNAVTRWHHGTRTCSCRLRQEYSRYQGEDFNLEHCRPFKARSRGVL